jgi:SpoIID/LytB domain protein
VRKISRSVSALLAAAFLTVSAAAPAGADDGVSAEATDAARHEGAFSVGEATPAGGGDLLTPAAAAVAPRLVTMGRGFGHGRGMGQWGAFGYATAYAASHSVLLDWYYGGTARGLVDTNRDIRAKLSAYDGSWFIAVSDTGNLVTPSTPGVRYWTMLVIPVGDGTFGIFKGGDCNPDGPWTFVNIVPGPVQFWVDGMSPHAEDPHQWFGMCSGVDVRFYRGWAEAVQTYAGPRVINQLPVEQYLKGVVPREMPASWGDASGGAGLEALMVQAVAARSYALTENRAPGIYDICDTAACQVYGGAALYRPATGTRWLEDNRTNAAIGGTLGEVRIWPDGSGVARTEYSASTGGHTAGGRFPAVPDWGDESTYQGNPNFRWQHESSLQSVQASFPQVGQVTAIEVTGRNGIGEWGGRATEVRIRGTQGTATTDGQTFGSLAGLGTDWFDVVTVKPGT